MIPYAERGLQPRPECFDDSTIFEPYGKLCELGNIPRPALEVYSLNAQSKT